MKKYISVLAMSALVLSSCSDFLDVQPEGDFNAQKYFQNDEQAKNAVDGLYYNFFDEEMYGMLIHFEQCNANDLVMTADEAPLSVVTLKYTGEEWTFTDSYEYINVILSRSNWVIQGLLQKQHSTTLSKIEKRSLGEAYFTRGWAHFLLAYRYGTGKIGVPFVRYEDFAKGYDNSIPPQRATVMENYELIIDDMNHAIENLPKFEEYDTPDKGRAHQAAAVAFKAKVYAYWAAWDKSQWTKVIEQVDLLENTYNRALASNFSEIFSSDFEDFWNSEYIWSIPSSGGTSIAGGVIFPGLLVENKGWGKFNSWGTFQASLDIYEEMKKDGDENERLRKSILEYGQEFVFWGETKKYASAQSHYTGFQINKYMDPVKHENAINKGYVNSNPNRPTLRINFPIIRFAEMLLFRAEANLMNGNAAAATKDLNRIRERSHLKPIEGNATFKDLYHERRCELAFEPTDHFYDLKRWHLSGSAELKELAKQELNASPRVREYETQTDYTSSYVVKPYQFYSQKATYSDKLIVFPYPSEEITKSNGKLQQNNK